MNFPMENPLFRLFYWLINTAGVGGATVLLMAGGLLAASLLTVWWVTRGAKADESEVYTFPTSTLLDHGDSEERYL